MSQQSWVSATLVLILLSLASKVFGFAREILVAKYFGVSPEVDAYMVALTLPMVMGGVIGSSLGTSLIPAYHRISTGSGQRGADRLCNTTVSFTTIVSVFLILVLYIFPAAAIRLLAPSFPVTTVNTAIGLLKWLSVLVLGYSLYNVQTAIYNARHHFTTPALADVLSNFFVIGSLIFLSSVIGIYALATGLIAGVYAVAVTLLVVMKRSGISGFGASFRAADFRELLTFSIPVFLNMLIPQLGGIIENYFASGLQEGSVAALGYARRLADIGSTLMAVNIAKAVFPTFSALYSENRIEKLRDMVLKLNSQIVVFFMPISIALMYFRKEVIALVFMRGAFGVQALEMTSNAFLFYVVGFVASMMLPLFFRLCYAFSDSATPLRAALASVLFTVAGNYLLVPVMGIAGIALTTSLSIVLNLSILFISVRRKLGGLGVLSLARSFHISFLCATAPLLPFVLLKSAQRLGFWVDIAMYFAMYFALGWIFMRDELKAFLSTLGTMRAGKK